LSVDVVGYLESKGIELRRAPNMNVRTLCWFCDEKDTHDDPAQGRLYIKVDPDEDPAGKFFCHLCETKGTINKLRHSFGDGPVSEASVISGRTLQALNAAAEYYHSNLDVTAVEYLTEARGLSPATIERMRFGVADGKLGEHLLLKNFTIEEIASTGLVFDTARDLFKPGWITIPFFDQRQCMQIRARDLTVEKNKYRSPLGQDQMLWNLDTLTHAEEVIVTEGEFDAAILEEMGYNAVGVPGSRAWQPEWARYFADVRRVYIAFDNDAPGIEGAEKVATSIGTTKTRIVEMPDPELGEKKVDITDFFVKRGHRKEDFDALLRRASKGHLVRVEDAYEAWTNREGNPDLQGLKFGISQLDVAITHGLLPGQVMVPLARTGSGKTILMINLMQRMIEMSRSDPKKPEGIKILFVSLEQMRNEWFERARRIHGFYNDHLVPGQDLELETIENYKRNLILIDKNRLTMDELRMDIMQAEDELGGLDLVIVDYLGYWSRSFKGEPYVRVSDAIMALKEVSKDTELPIITPHQVNRGSKPGTDISLNDARESGVIEETADIAVALMNDDKNPGVRIADHTGRMTILVLKSRNGGEGTEAELCHAKISLAMVPKVDEVFASEYYDRAKYEVDCHKKGFGDYTEMLYRHRTGDRSLILPAHSNTIIQLSS
jgi:hypothetical protein